MSQPLVDLGSFRDPGGHVFLRGDKVFRTVKPIAVDDFDRVEATGVIDELVSRGWCLPAAKVDHDHLGLTKDRLGSTMDRPTYVLEHPKIELISYPYEWPFRALKAAALLHLDIQLLALGYDVALSDASAYNIQFRGSRPVFIDRLSFVPYKDGDIWIGHRQFCEQFLNPLLLRSVLGVPHNAWYRGAQEGIATDDLNRLIPLGRKFSWQIFAHVVLQSKFQASARGTSSKTTAQEARRSRYVWPIQVVVGAFADESSRAITSSEVSRLRLRRIRENSGSPARPGNVDTASGREILANHHVRNRSSGTGRRFRYSEIPFRPPACVCFMSISVNCPNPDCGKTYTISDAQVGKRGTCKSCGTKFTFVPQTIGAESPNTDTQGPAAESSRSASTAPQKLVLFARQGR